MTLRAVFEKDWRDVFVESDFFGGGLRFVLAGADGRQRQQAGCATHNQSHCKYPSLFIACSSFKVVHLPILRLFENRRTASAIGKPTQSM